MVNKALTHSDLQNLKNEIKLDWEKEFKDHRHSFWGKVQDDYNKIDEKVTEYKSDLRLTNATMQRMQEDITEIKDLLTDFMKTIPNIYATKEEHRANQKEIESMKDSHKKIIAWLLWTHWTAFVWFIWVVIKTLWIK